MRWYLVLGLGVATACTGSTDDSPDDGGPDPVEACESVVATVTPMPDSMDVAVDTMITVTFDPALPEGGNWVLSLADVGGTEVAGAATLAADGASATFVPEADLAFETVYTVSATACDDTKSAEFLTGAAPVEPMDLEGTTFAIEESDLQISEPGGTISVLLGALEGGLFGTLAVQFDSYDSDAETFAGVGAVIGQDDAVFCEQQVSTEVDFSGNPVVSFGPDDLEIDLGDGQTLTLEDLEVQGRVAADGLSLVDPSVSLAIASESIPVIALGPCADIVSSPLIMPTCVPCDSSPSGECLLFAGTVEAANAIDRDIIEECSSAN